MADNKSSEGILIGGKRYCGKTTELIRKAFRDQLYILCANKHMAQMIFNQAKEMDLEIPYPITPDDLPLTSSFANRILVDEVEMVLSQLVGKRVVGMSSSMKFEELDSLKKSSKDIDLKLNVEVSDAIKGLKAIQREAKKSTAALKELDNIKKHTCPECKTISLDINTLTANDEVYSINQLCKNCGWSNNESYM